MNRGHGWKPDPTDIPKLRSGQIKLCDPSSLPSSVDYSNKVKIVDQGSTHTCVAHCASLVVRIADWNCREAEANGGLFRIPEVPSARWLYEKCTSRDGNAGIDDGTFMTTAFSVMNEIGFVKESKWPWNPRKLFQRAPDSVAYHAHDQAGSVKQYGLYNPTKEKLMQILASGHPIAAAAYIDTPYQDCWRKKSLRDTILDLDGPLEGGHAMAIVGYNEYGLIHAGTWGDKFGYKGFALVSWAGAQKLRNMRVVTNVREATS
jgi:C1A family cysteine protease